MISVIIPTYNSGNVIGKCLQALGKQTAKNCEIIVVDDGSRDETASIAKSYKNIIFFEKEHKGPASARNFGAKMAKGDILLFTDSDCEPDKNWIAEMTALFKDKSVAGVSGTYRTRQKELIAKFAQYEIEERHEKMAGMKSIDFIGTFSAGYRKKIFDKFNGFDESFSTSAGEDPELSFRIAEAGHKMVFAPNAFVYHQHPDTIWKYLKQKYRNAYWRYFVYQKREKTFERGHSYTPKSAFWEIALAGFWVFSAIGDAVRWIIFRSSLSVLWIAVYHILPIIAILLLSSSLLTYIFKRDFSVGFLALFIIPSRAVVGGFGIFRGFVDDILRRSFK